MIRAAVDGAWPWLPIAALMPDGADIAFFFCFFFVILRVICRRHDITARVFTCRYHTPLLPC